jgi:hypothetical protein
MCELSKKVCYKVVSTIYFRKIHEMIIKWMSKEGRKMVVIIHNGSSCSVLDMGSNAD